MVGGTLSEQRQRKEAAQQLHVLAGFLMTVGVITQKEVNLYVTVTELVLFSVYI